MLTLRSAVAEAGAPPEGSKQSRGRVRAPWTDAGPRVRRAKMAHGAALVDRARLCHLRFRSAAGDPPPAGSGAASTPALPMAVFQTSRRSIASRKGRRACPEPAERVGDPSAKLENGAALADGARTANSA
jgi:hypothetical protein